MTPNLSVKQPHTDKTPTSRGAREHHAHRGGGALSARSAQLKR